ncbi:MAG: hypothetical protein NT154_24505 [Verrucomicrobia bacterium]|nr:hypothetical protein [Verrucomicrobiota bacterium]
MKLTKQNTAPSVVRLIRDNLAQFWQRIRITWQSENNPAWRMSLPNPLPRRTDSAAPTRQQKDLGKGVHSISSDRHDSPF